ncbi:receptor-type adenylate cyclase, partial [Trypanosoma conorhini]
MSVCWRRRGCSAHFGSRPSAAAPCLVLLLLLLLPLPPHGAAVQAADPYTLVKILIVRQNDLGPLTPMSTAFYAGLRASLKTHVYTYARDVPLDIVYSRAKLAGYVNALEKVMQKEEGILTLLAQFGDASVMEVRSTLNRFDLVSFA